MEPKKRCEGSRKWNRNMMETLVKVRIKTNLDFTQSGRGICSLIQSVINSNSKFFNNRFEVFRDKSRDLKRGQRGD